MINYDLDKQTVTISISDYQSFVREATTLGCVMQLLSPDGKRELRRLYHARLGKEWSFDELDAYALRILNVNSATDYEIQVANEWLGHQMAYERATNIAEWCAISRDLRQQLIVIAENTNY